MGGDISHEGLRVLLRQEGVTFQRLTTWKASKDKRYAEKKARAEHLYAIADREITPKDGEPGRAPRRRMRAAYTRTAGVRHLFAAYELGEDKLFGHIKPRKTRTRFLEFCRLDSRAGRTGG